MEELSFDLVLAEVPVVLRNPQTNQVINYVLREATGETAVAFMNARLAGLGTTPDGGVSRFGEHAGRLEPLLVSKCLFRLVEQPDGTVKEIPATIAEVQAFPAKVQKALFDKAKEISEIDMPDTEEDLQKQIDVLQKRLDALRNGKEPAKNEPSGTTDGSD